MPSVEKLSIALTPDLAALVRQAVEEGGYASTSEVIRDALREWTFKRAYQRQQLNEVRRLWAEGISSGPGCFSGIDEIIAEAKNRFHAAREND